MNIRFSKAALKTLQRCDASLRERIRSRVEGLTKTPPEGDIKPLAGMAGTYRLRVGEYRVIYRYEMGTLCIDDIGSRGDIYK